MKRTLLLGSVLMLIQFACELPPPPPLAPLTSTQIITGPTDGSIASASSVTFRWVGSQDADSFQYQSDGGAWSPWTKTDSARLEYLDEGSHSFAVRSLHKNHITVESGFPQRTFTVDAVKGQSLMFAPRLRRIQSGQSFTYGLNAEEVSGLFGAMITLQYDHTAIRIDSIRFGGLTTANGGSAIQFPSVNTIDNGTGRAVINMVITGGTPQGISGSGPVATLYCRLLQPGGTGIQFVAAETALRDTINNPITIRSLIPGRIESQ